MERRRGRVNWPDVVEAVGYWVAALFWLIAALFLAWFILTVGR